MARGPGLCVRPPGAFAGAWRTGLRGGCSGSQTGPRPVLGVSGGGAVGHGALTASSRCGLFVMLDRAHLCSHSPLNGFCHFHLRSSLELFRFPAWPAGQCRRCGLVLGRAARRTRRTDWSSSPHAVPAGGAGGARGGQPGPRALTRPVAAAQAGRLGGRVRGRRAREAACGLGVGPAWGQTSPVCPPPHSGRRGFHSPGDFCSGDSESQPLACVCPRRGRCLSRALSFSRAVCFDSHVPEC